MNSYNILTKENTAVAALDNKQFDSTLATATNLNSIHSNTTRCFIPPNMMKIENENIFKCDNCNIFKKKLAISRNWNRFYKEKLINIDRVLHIISQFEREKEKNLELQLAYDQRSREWTQQQEQLIGLLHEVQPLKERVKHAEEELLQERKLRIKHETIEESLHLTIAQLEHKIAEIRKLSNPGYVENLEKKLLATKQDNKKFKCDLECKRNEIEELKLYINNNHGHTESLTKKYYWALNLAETFGKEISNGDSLLKFKDDWTALQISLSETTATLKSHYKSFKAIQSKKLEGKRLELSLLPTFSAWVKEFERENSFSTKREEEALHEEEANDVSDDIESEANQLEKLLSEGNEENVEEKNEVSESTFVQNTPEKDASRFKAPPQKSGRKPSSTQSSKSSYTRKKGKENEDELVLKNVSPQRNKSKSPENIPPPNWKSKIYPIKDTQTKNTIITSENEDSSGKRNCNIFSENIPKNITSYKYPENAWQKKKIDDNFGNVSLSRNSITHSEKLQPKRKSNENVGNVLPEKKSNVSPASAPPKGKLNVHSENASPKIKLNAYSEIASPKKRSNLYPVPISPKRKSNIYARNVSPKGTSNVYSDNLLSKENSSKSSHRKKKELTPHKLKHPNYPKQSLNLSKKNEVKLRYKSYNMLSDLELSDANSNDSETPTKLERGISVECVKKEFNIKKEIALKPNIKKEITSKLGEEISNLHPENNVQPKDTRLKIPSQITREQVNSKKEEDKNMVLNIMEEMRRIPIGITNSFSDDSDSSDSSIEKFNYSHSVKRKSKCNKQSQSFNKELKKNKSSSSSSFDSNKNSNETSILPQSCEKQLLSVAKSSPFGESSSNLKKKSYADCAEKRKVFRTNDLLNSSTESDDVLTPADKPKYIPSFVYKKEFQAKDLLCDSSTECEDALSSAEDSKTVPSPTPVKVLKAEDTLCDTGTNYKDTLQLVNDSNSIANPLSNTHNTTSSYSNLVALSSCDVKEVVRDPLEDSVTKDKIDKMESNDLSQKEFDVIAPESISGFHKIEPICEDPQRSPTCSSPINSLVITREDENLQIVAKEPEEEKRSSRDETSNICIGAENQLNANSLPPPLVINEVKCKNGSNLTSDLFGNDETASNSVGKKFATAKTKMRYASESSIDSLCISNSSLNEETSNQMSDTDIKFNESRNVDYKIKELFESTPKKCTESPSSKLKYDTHSIVNQLSKVEYIKNSRECSWSKNVKLEGAVTSTTTQSDTIKSFNFYVENSSKKDIEENTASSTWMPFYKERTNEPEVDSVLSTPVLLDPEREETTSSLETTDIKRTITIRGSESSAPSSIHFENECNYIAQNAVFQIEEPFMSCSALKESLEEILGYKVRSKEWNGQIENISKIIIGTPAPNMLTKLQPLVRCMLCEILKMSPNEDTSTYYIPQTFYKLLQIARITEIRNELPPFTIDNLINASAHKLILSANLRPNCLAALTTWFVNSCYIQYNEFDQPTDEKCLHRCRSFLIDVLFHHKGMVHQSLLSALFTSKKTFIRMVKYRESTCVEKMIFWIAHHGLWIGPSSTREELVEAFHRKLGLLHKVAEGPINILRSSLQVFLDNSPDDDKRTDAISAFLLLLRWQSAEWIRKTSFPLAKNIIEDNFAESEKPDLVSFKALLGLLIKKVEWTEEENKLFLDEVNSF